MKVKLTTLLGALLVASTLTAGAAKPFLIQGKLPHLTMLVKAFWNDADVAFTEEQKSKLLIICKNTMEGAKKLAQQINPLEAKIVKETKEGATPKSLQKSVSKLASLRAEATMLHISCIYNTKAILTEDQIDIIE